uniref:Secreted protein n=1 Tax=Panagrellus redivivus TaxID=6233 RepID=A0A7E4ZSX1_PANRE
MRHAQSVASRCVHHKYCYRVIQLIVWFFRVTAMQKPRAQGLFSRHWSPLSSPPSLNHLSAIWVTLAKKQIRAVPTSILFHVEKR